jgi:hypothetical protein
VLYYNRYHGNAFKGFRELWDNIYERVLYYNRYHGNDFKGFRELWDNIYECFVVSRVAQSV